MRLSILVSVLLLFSACASKDAVPGFIDFLEIRGLSPDDALAPVFSDMDGVKHRLGDPIFSGRTLGRFQFKQINPERFDLLLTLTGVDEVRWQRFARSRTGDQAALLINGKIYSMFTVVSPGIPEEGKAFVLTIPEITKRQEEAERLDQYFESRKSARKEK